MAERAGTVVVLGGSVAGILATAVAARHADRVVLVERDALEGAAASRKGVPQGRHNHNLTPRGLAVMERLLPGLTGELRARGASVVDSGAEGRWSLGGVPILRVTTGRLAALASRPCLDASLFARLRTLPNVAIRDRTDVVGLVTDAERPRVAGVRVVARGEEAGEEELRADLVIDATGRGLRMPAWLAELGHAEPRAEEQEVRVAYATRSFGRRPADLQGDRYVFASARAPDLPRGGVAFAVDGDRWMVLLFGYGGVRPPVDLDGFRSFAASLPSPDIAELVRGLEPIDDGAVFSYPKAVRRRYDQLRDVPEGVLLFGDALVSTNPSWGLGMTTAALQAEALEAAFAGGVRGLPRRFFAAALEATAPIWDGTTQNDLAFDCVPGSLSRPLRWIRTYVGAVIRTAGSDPVVARAMLAVIDRVAPPPSLFAPAVALRVLRVRLARGRAEESHGAGAPA